jgi:hypothetical protein
MGTNTVRAVTLAAPALYDQKCGMILDGRHKQMGHGSRRRPIEASCESGLRFKACGAIGLHLPSDNARRGVRGNQSSDIEPMAAVIGC